nr:xylulose kinase-1 [Tanacetum cinerariifolium]
MISILEKSEHNIDFHQIVDFIEDSHIRYALTINPNVYVSHIRQFWSTARIETTNKGTKILATVDGKPMTISESSIRKHLKLNDKEGISSLPDTEIFENLALMGYNIFPNKIFTFQKETPTKTPTIRQYSRRATRIAQSKALSTTADEHASLLRDDSQGEAFPTVFSLDAGHDRENINKTSALPHESTPKVISLDADEGTQDLEISNLKARIKLLDDKDRGSAEPSGDDAPIKGRSMEIEEEVEVERSIELGSNDTEEMVNVLTSMEAANILTSGVAAVSVSPVAGVSTVGVPTVSGLFPTVSASFTIASVVTPYSRHPRGISAKDKGKKKVVEYEEPKKKNLQEQIDAQVAREIEEEITREDQRMNEQLTRDAEIAKIHAEEELKMLIDGLDRSNEVIAKHLQEYEQSEAKLTIGETIELINELEIKEKFIPVWKQIEYFVSMSSTEEAKRVKRKGLKLDQGSSKRMKTSEDVSEEDLKGMMQLVHVEEVYVEALQVKHPIID